MHCMLDLETWGKKPGCAPRSVGAVMFDESGLHEVFYANIADDTALAVGLVKDPSTEKWWEDQSKAAQEALLVDQKPLGDVLVAFAGWWRQCGARWVWGHGATFDPPILEAAFDAFGLDAPWDFWNVRCSRTVLAMANRKPSRAGGTHHNALDDAKAQAIAVVAAMRHKVFSLG